MIESGRSATREYLARIDRAHGLLKGDQTASGPGRQWLCPAIFRRAPASVNASSVIELRALHREAK
jgi:hypothetical protein